MQNDDIKSPDDFSSQYGIQNDILALKRAFSLPDINYTDISQREQLNAALKHWPLLAELVQQ